MVGDLQWEVRNFLVCSFESDRWLFYAFFLYSVMSSEYVVTLIAIFSEFDRFEVHNPQNTENWMQDCASQAPPRIRWGFSATHFTGVLEGFTVLNCFRWRARTRI